MFQQLPRQAVGQLGGSLDLLSTCANDLLAGKVHFTYRTKAVCAVGTCGNATDDAVDLQGAAVSESSVQHAIQRCSPAQAHTYVHCML